MVARSGRISVLSAQYPPVISSRDAPSGDLLLSTSYQDVPGLSLTLEPGTWLIFGTFNWGVTTHALTTCRGQLDLGGVAQSGVAIWVASNDWEQTVDSQVWRKTVAVSTTIKLQGKKDGDVGTFYIYAGGTSLAALRSQE